MGRELREPSATRPAAPFGLARGDTHLLRVGNGKPAKFGAGSSPIDAFAIARAGASDVAIARTDSLELWSEEGKRLWTAKRGPWIAVAVSRDHVGAVGGDGALVFASRKDGELEGALRLASTEPAHMWRLAHVDGAAMVLALGEWVVWVDAKTRKVIRRVRARAKVGELRADQDLVVVALEGGVVQAFRAPTGEPRSSFVAHEEGIKDLELAPEAVYTCGLDGETKEWERTALDAPSRASAPITAVAGRGELVAVGDRSGRVRVMRGEREVASLALGEGVLGVHLGANDMLVAATARIVVRTQRPWDNLRPVALRAQPTAFAADDAYAFAGTQTGAVEVYDLTAGRHLTTYALSSEDRVTAIARLPGKLLVVGTGALDGRVIVVDVVEAKVRHRICAHDDAFAVTCLASEARGRLVASGSDDGTIALIDPVLGRHLARIRVPETPVSIAFEGNGRRFACAFADGTAAIVTLAQKGTSVTDVGLRGVVFVAWGAEPVFGHADGTVGRALHTNGAQARA